MFSLFTVLPYLMFGTEERKMQSSLVQEEAVGTSLMGG